jgi:fibronectin type 3 domain-containing protein
MWKKNSSNDSEKVKSYKIYRKQASQGVSSYKHYETVNDSTFRFEDRALSVNYKYSYVLTTLDNEGEESDHSNEVSEPLVFPPVNLSTESSLDNTATKKINTVRWQKNPRNDSTVKNYRVYRKEEDDTVYKDIGAISGSAYAYQDKNLPTGKKYAYRLTAVDKNNRECEPSYSIREDYVFPPINMNLKTINNEGMFFKEKINRLRWKRNPLNDPVNVVKYAIYRKTTEENKSSYVRIFEDLENAFEFWDRNLPSDARYIYRLTSVCENGAESEHSNPRVEK